MIKNVCMLSQNSAPPKVPPGTTAPLPLLVSATDNVNAVYMAP